MPGFVIHVGAQAMCAHGGPALPTVPNPRVLVGGMPTVLQKDPFSVAGCPFNVSGSPVPCTIATWTLAAFRVTSLGIPLVLFDSIALAAPNMLPLQIVSSQVRVKAM